MLSGIGLKVFPNELWLPANKVDKMKNDAYDTQSQGFLMHDDEQTR